MTKRRENGTSVARLSKDTGLPIDTLLHHLSELDVVVSGSKSSVSSTDQLRLLQRLRTIEDEASTKRQVTLTDIKSAPTLPTLNGLLTRAMATKQIQVLIDGRGLDAIVNRILELEKQGHHRDELLSAAALQRLSAVVRGDRKLIALGRISDAISHEPPSIDTLPDADTKTYAAQALAQIEQSWLDSYLAREAVAIDTADHARREILKQSLRRAGNIASWISGLTKQVNSVQGLSSTAKQNRVRRIFGCARDVVQESRYPVGIDIGPSLANCLARFFAQIDRKQFEESTMFDSVDHLLSILQRSIELRFSEAMQPDTYRLLGQARMSLGVGFWNRFGRDSTILPELRGLLLEAILVLSRQNRTDSEIAEVLVRSYPDRRQAVSAVKRHFSEVRDLDPQTEDWWVNLGKVTRSQQDSIHKVGTSEDIEIANALIEMERARNAIGKIDSAIAPLLDISDPVLALTARTGVAGFREVEQPIRRLARMRRLASTEWSGEVVEYNPLQHELVGGHMPGVRKVKVIREGVEKDFRGRRRMLVKPWVERLD